MATHGRRVNKAAFALCVDVLFAVGRGSLYQVRNYVLLNETEGRYARRHASQVIILLLMIFACLQTAKRIKEVAVDKV